MTDTNLTKFNYIEILHPQIQIKPLLGHINKVFNELKIKSPNIIFLKKLYSL